MTPRVAVVSGPAGVGKGTVVSRLAAAYPQVWVSVSATTREPRRGEVEGVHYRFVSDAEFDHLVATNGLLEWATVHKKARYGTPKQPVLDAIAEGRTVILEIDVQGARQVRRTLPEASFIFIEPPSWDELVRRLTGRGTENAEQRARRLTTAREEMAARDEFDEIVTNDELGETVQKLVGLLGLTGPAALPEA